MPPSIKENQPQISSVRKMDIIGIIPKGIYPVRVPKKTVVPNFGDNFVKS